jgi:hypothetical protein
MIRSAVALGFLLAAPLLFAQTPPPRLEPLPEVPPPPPGVRDIAPDEPRVRIASDTESVEEVREGGRVVMYKVTPRGGVPYYLYDTTAAATGCGATRSTTALACRCGGSSATEACVSSHRRANAPTVR